MADLEIRLRHEHSIEGVTVAHEATGVGRAVPTTVNENLGRHGRGRRQQRPKRAQLGSSLVVISTPDAALKVLRCFVCNERAPAHASVATSYHRKACV
jgi:hypothetical protein